MSKKIQSLIRIGIGSMFVIAAILKLLSIDEFEIYIYSFNIFNFFITTILSRLLIACEFVLGLFLIFKMYYKFTWKAILAIQIVFSLFLIYVIIFRNDDNCHCFGDFVELSPLHSIIKNLMIIGALFLIKSQINIKSENRIITQTAKFIPAISLMIVFIISPTDSIYKMIYSTEKEISTIDLQESFEEVVNINFENDTLTLDTISSFKIKEGNHMIAIVSSGCKYCKLGIKKMAMIMERKGNDSENVDIFIWGSPEGILDFREETSTESYSYWHIMPNKAIDIAYGRFPIFIWLDKKEIVNVGDFRDIDDDLNI